MLANPAEKLNSFVSPAESHLSSHTKARYFVMEGELFNGEIFLFTVSYVSLFALIQEIDRGTIEMKIIRMVREASDINDALLETNDVQF